MKKIKIFDLKEQYKTISKEINKNVLDILSSGQYILGKNLLKLEENFSKYVGANYAVGCNSGTDALLLSLRAMNIGPGDEVITSPFSYFATAEVIALTGAKPVFADINPHTFNINHKLIEKLITKKTKAIIPVHLYGQACEITEIRRICRRYNLFLIEDCAQSFGAKDNLEVKSIIMTSLIIAGSLGVLIIIISIPSINFIQTLLSASEESKDLMKQYILIRI